MKCREHTDRNLSAIADKKSKRQEFENQLAETQNKIAELDEKIADFTGKIAVGGGSLDALEAQVSAAKQKLDSILGKFDAATNKKLNQYFENDSNFSLVAGISSLVAILRNNKTASNVDVELYLKDYEKLIFKLRQADVKNLSVNTVNFHQKELSKIIGAFTNSSHADYAACAEFAHYVQWAQAFADYALQAIVLLESKQGTSVLEEEKEKQE